MTKRELAYHANWRAKNRASINARMRLYEAAWMRWLDSLKRKPCKDCKHRFPPCVMDFDHRPGQKKILGVARMRRCNKAKVLREIAKCDLVCANCHRIRTQKRARRLARQKRMIATN